MSDTNGKSSNKATTYKVNESSGGCPFHNGETRLSAGSGTKNRDWWPNKLNLNILRQHSSLSDPMGEDFNYAEEFSNLI